ncbi:Arc family DNA-binding protein [Sphingobium sp. Sx8-8]|uniref:FitA-like ribbon-helix-helix domain-containing protein n=1 Tax=Sphingobium sp. Sx8-8 TaxID=2933617 RepID=UPI001F5A2700|nr:Arc family DNA-binding protein [Sphingobium sp. Sx8-8]
MASITVRNIPDEVHRALRVRAARHGRSTEAEIRFILEQAARPEGRRLMGAALSETWGANGLTAEETRLLEGARDRGPTTPMSFD